MFRVQVDDVLCNLPAAILFNGSPVLGYIESWEVAARNVEANAVTTLKDK
jgi:hypothetical protein